MEGGFQYGGALPGAVPGIRVSVCELDSGQVGIAHDDIEVAGERARRLGLLPSLGGPVRGRNRRISRIFSHDGPGLPKSTVRGQAYRAIESRIRKTVPESSVVGMLLQSNAPVRIVKADAIGIMQHMGNSWQVAENGDFEQVDELTAGAQLIKRTLDGWLDTVSQEQRERAIDQIYGIFAAAGYGNIADLVEHWTDSLPKIVEAARNTDRETRGLIRAVIKAIPVSAAKAVREG